MDGSKLVTIFKKKKFAKILLCSIEILENAIKEINAEILKLKDSLKLLIILSLIVC
jgi:hypothetical protein